MKYSFCESYAATGTFLWHIRELSHKGPKFSGGIDTPFLCGRKVQGWDLEVSFDLERYKNCVCPKCLEEYRGRVE